MKAAATLITMVSLLFGAQTMVIHRSNGTTLEMKTTDVDSITFRETSGGGGGDSQYHLHTGINASTFWAGEGASGDNHNISNVPSAWDNQWGDNFGVEDYPQLERDSDFIPTDWRYKKIENPYYFALPYNDLGSVVYDGKNANSVASQNSSYSAQWNSDYGRTIVTTSDMVNITDWDVRKASTSRIPWRDEEDWGGKSMVKAKWIRIRHKGGSWVYAQWADAGPYYYDDADYVFGTAKPANMRLSTDDPYAGIDLSPSVMLALGVELGEWGANIENVDWQFVDAADVPEGPWKRYISSNATNWQ